MRNELFVIRLWLTRLIKSLADSSMKGCEVNEGNVVLPAVLIFGADQQTVIIVRWLDHNPQNLMSNLLTEVLKGCSEEPFETRSFVTQLLPLSLEYLK